MVVAPSLLACDFLNVESELNRLQEAQADWLHLDVMDGQFVPNITFGYDLIKEMRKKSNLFFDTHLMIDHPQKYITNFVDAGSNLITFHFESKDDPKSVISEIKKHDVKVGISIKPNTSVEEISQYLKDVDLVLIMSVEPGFGGQSFMPESIDKINQLIEYREASNLEYLIQIDGGINDKTIEYVKDDDVVVAGSFVFNENMKENINLLREIK